MIDAVISFINKIVKRVRVDAARAILWFEFYFDVRGDDAWVAIIVNFIVVTRLGWQSVRGTFFSARPSCPVIHETAAGAIAS